MTQHTEHSSYREKLIEHLFVAELLKLSWLHYDCTLEISKPEVDDSGYDIVAESAGVIRHIQLKTSKIGGKTASQKVHTKLSEKPSGCVIWIYFNEETLELGPFRFFGSLAGMPLPNLGEKIARQTRGNKDGVKSERPNIRVIPQSKFDKFKTIEDIYAQLFKRSS